MSTPKQRAHFSFSHLESLVRDIRTHASDSTDHESLRDAIPQRLATFRQFLLALAARNEQSPFPIHFDQHDVLAAKHPQPSPAEKAWVQSASAPFSLLPTQAAFFVRHFLVEKYGKSALHLFEKRANTLPPAFSRSDVESYWSQEILAAKSSILHILLYSSKGSGHPLQEHFQAILDESMVNIKKDVVSAVRLLLESIHTRELQRVSSIIDSEFVLELLFALAYCGFLAPDDIMSILESYVKCIEVAASRPPLSEHHAQGTLFGTYSAAVLFVAAVNRVWKPLRTAYDPSYSEDDSSVSTTWGNFARNSSSIDTITNLIRSLQKQNCLESALVNLSWSAVMELRNQKQNLSVETASYINYALSCNALPFLTMASKADLQISDDVSCLVFSTLFDDISSFLSCFPPSNVTIEQASEITEMVNNLLKKSGEEKLRAYATAMWVNGNDEVAPHSNDVVLKMCTALYPLAFTPLTSFLSSTVIDVRSAAFTANHLEYSLNTVTESAVNYAEALVAVDENPNIIWSSLYEQYGAESTKAASTLSTRFAEGGNSIFVQAAADIAASAYRPALPLGSIGVSDDGIEVVTWFAAWDGFRAIFLVLGTAIDYLSGGEQTHSYSEDAGEQLMSSTIEALKLISKLFTYGSSTVRKHVDELCTAQRMRLVSLVSGIINGLNSGKTPNRLLPLFVIEEVLTVALRCIIGVVGNSEECASLALAGWGHSYGNFLQVLDSPELKSLVNGTIALLSHVNSRRLQSLEARDNIGIELRTSKKGDKDISFLSCALSPRSLEISESDLVRSRVLPWWLSSPKENQSDNVFQWFVPVCMMRRFIAYPEVLMYDSGLASTLCSSVVAAVNARTLLPGHSYLFPALCVAVGVCLEFLSMRRALHGKILENRESKDSELLKPSALETEMIREEVQEAFAMLASGNWKCSGNMRFFTAWASLDYGPTITEILKELRPESKAISTTIGSSVFIFAREWGKWISDTSADCLSNLYYCLWQAPSCGEILQVSWPRFLPHVENDKGTALRRNLMNAIRDDNRSSVIRLIRCSVAYGQRIITRSLLDAVKTPGDEEKDKAIRKTEYFQDHTENVGDEIYEPPLVGVLDAVMACLKTSIKSFVELSSSEDVVARSSSLCTEESVEISCRISECVTFLRAWWESPKSKSLREPFKMHDGWKALGSLLSCGSFRSSTARSETFNLKDALRYCNDEVATRNEDHVQCERPYCLQRVIVWKRIASNALCIFSSEILRTARKELRKKEHSGTDNGKVSRLPEALFRENLYREFASAFSERWMFCLLLPVAFTSGKNLDGMEIESSSLGFGKKGTDNSSLAQQAKDIRRDIASLIGISNTSVDMLLHATRQRDEMGRPTGLDELDLQQIHRLLNARGVAESERDVLLDRLRSLNLELASIDTYTNTAKIFTLMAGSILFVDSCAPDGSLKLTYSSSQFGGKLSRFLCHLLIRLTPSLEDSADAVAVSGAFAELLCSLVYQMKPSEVEQAALTAIKISPCSPALSSMGSMSPVGQICSFLLVLTSQHAFVTKKNFWFQDVCETVRWLLVAAALLVDQPSFSDSGDFRRLGECCFTVLKRSGGDAVVCKGVSIALTAVFEKQSEDVCSLLSSERLSVLFSAINSLSAVSSGNSDAAESCSSLFLTIAGLHGALKARPQLKCSILRNMNVGSLQAFLPAVGVTIPSYTQVPILRRNPTHSLWCNAMLLASSVIPTAYHISMSGQEKEQLFRDIVDFSSTHLMRVATDSLDVSGDWTGPWYSRLRFSKNTTSREALADIAITTIARVEESEIAAGLVYKLSNFAVKLSSSLPRSADAILKQLCRYIHQCLQILRTEPTERCVRPATQQECECSALLNGSMEDGDVPSSLLVRDDSPPQSSTGGPSTPKGLRSPSRAIRAAVSDPSTSPNYHTPMTPQSPLVSFKSREGPRPHLAALSGCGPGLIVGQGQSFAEEVWNCALRGICAALNALNTFCTKLDLSLFAPNMDSSEETPGVGVLVRIQKLAHSYLQNGADGELRVYLIMLADASMHLLMHHIVKFSEAGSMAQGTKDELRKRMTTNMSRMGKILPPLPNTSLFGDEDIRQFWKTF